MSKDKVKKERVPADVAAQFEKAISDAKSEIREGDYILPAWWIRVEPWCDDCLEGSRNLDSAFKKFIEAYRKQYGFVAVRTVWVDNGGLTDYGSSVTLFRKTRETPV